MTDDTDVFDDISLHLIDDKQRLDQLGNSVRKWPFSTTQADTSKLTDIEAAKFESQRYSLNVRCTRPRISSCEHDGEIIDACLMTLSFAFLPNQPGSLYRHVDVMVTFYDGPRQPKAPKSDEEEDAMIDALRLRPTILQFAPGYWQDVPETIDSEDNIDITPNLDIGAFGAVGGIGLTRRIPRRNQGLRSIVGQKKGTPASEIQWSLHENELRSSGIVSRFTAPLLLHISKDRTFNMKVEVRATVDGRWPVPRAHPKCGYHSIKFDPQAILSEQQRRCISVPRFIFTEDEFNKMTDLNGQGATFVPRGAGT